MDGGYERASTIGFRCAADAGPKPPQPTPPPPTPPSPSGDPRWFGGGRSTAMAVSWRDGAPDKAASSIRSGMYSVDLFFELSVAAAASAPLDEVSVSAPAPSKPGRAAPATHRLLKVLVGTFCCDGILTVTSTGTNTSVTASVPDVPAPCDHATGTRNIMWTISFDAALALTVRWTRKHTNTKDGSNLTFQSAALSAGKPGGVPRGCPDPICLADPAVLPAGTVSDLTDEGDIDWVHFGGLDRSPFPGTAALRPPLFAERKAGGSALAGSVKRYD